MDGKVYSFKSRERLASSINLILFLLIIVLCVLLVVYTDASLVFIFVYLLCSLPMYLIIEYMLTTSSYSLMAGYDSEVEYNEENLRKYLLDLQFSILAITTLHLIIELVILLARYRSSQMGGILIISYLIAYTLVIIIVIFRNKNKIKE